MPPVCSEPLAVTLTRRPDASALATWDELVRTTPGSDVAQLSAWADVRRPAGFQPLYLLVRQGTELVGGALVMTRKLPLIGEVGYVSYGPMLALDNDREPAVTEMVAALRESKRKLRALFVQPPLGHDDISLEFCRQGFRPSEAAIAPSASLRLDLTKTEDELRAGLRKRLRTWTRQWEPRGVKVRRGTEDDVALFARLHATSAQHQGFPALGFDYLANFYSCLAPEGHAELFVAEVNGRPVAARMYTGCGGVIKLRLLGMDRDDEAARLSVGSAIEWEAIRWAKANGYRWFDFGGIWESEASAIETEGTDSPKLRSTVVHKASFGGTPFRYPTPVEVISPGVLRVAYDLTQRSDAGRRLVDQARNTLRLRNKGRP
jgi:lipid II:glycine glycyltransferase (peptidoglycan interpeptide bridge formation enzyme)